MTTTYICGSCENKLDFDKDEGITIIYNCSYCEEQAKRLVSMCRTNVDTLIERHNKNVVDMVNKAMGVKL